MENFIRAPVIMPCRIPRQEAHSCDDHNQDGEKEDGHKIGAMVLNEGASVKYPTQPATPVTCAGLFSPPRAFGRKVAPPFDCLILAKSASAEKHGAANNPRAFLTGFATSAFRKMPLRGFQINLTGQNATLFSSTSVAKNGLESCFCISFSWRFNLGTAFDFIERQIVIAESRLNPAAIWCVPAGMNMNVWVFIKKVWRGWLDSDGIQDVISDTLSGNPSHRAF